MMTDIPYEKLKENKRAYEILLLHDWHGQKFRDIAKEYGLSSSGVQRIYLKIKIRQADLYIHHIAIALGHQDVTQIWNQFFDAMESYQDYFLACAYLEKEYGSLLAEYRGGEPGRRPELIDSLLPLKPKLKKRELARLVAMREEKKMTFRAIGERLRLTPIRARKEYDGFYREKVVKIIDSLQEQAESKEEKRRILDAYSAWNGSAKKYYDRLTAQGEGEKDG